MLTIETVALKTVEKNAEVKDEIRETLKKMQAGQSFVIEGKIKKGTVKAIAITENIKVKIGTGEDGKLRCVKI